MERLLATVHFRNSRRYPALFRFIVEETLEGRGEFLKERLLGVRVFNRPPDYDTADDPIARVTIAEIRKRIAQYYHEEAHETEMRIELMPGRYEPEFYPRKARVAPGNESLNPGAAAVSTLAPHADPPIDIPAHQAGKPPRTRYRSLLVTLAVLLIAALSAVGWRVSQRPAIDELWKPVLTSRHIVTFCLPSDAAGSRIAAAAGIISNSLPASKSPGPSVSSSDATSSTFLDYETNRQNVVFSDVLATMKISNWIATHNVEQKLRLAPSTALDDLQQGPTILIGGLDNAWTLRTIAHLRYQFRGTDQEQFWITDIKNPGSRKWEVDIKDQYASVKRDFALIARVHDDSTGQIQVIVAGIGMSGTAAAGEFMVDPTRIGELRRAVGSGFRNHDFEAVLGTDVVNGIPGSPKILAVEVW